MSQIKLVSPVMVTGGTVAVLGGEGGLEVWFSSLFTGWLIFLPVGGQVKNSHHLIAALFGAGGRERSVKLHCWPGLSLLQIVQSFWSCHGNEIIIL